MTPALRKLTSAIDLYLGDSMEVLRALRHDHPNGFADLVLTDPPYGIDYKSASGQTVLNDKEPPIWYVEPMVAAMKADAAMLLFTRWDVWPAWQREMQNCGLSIEAPIIWRKGSGGLGDSKSDGALNYEMCLVGLKGSPQRRVWQAEREFAGNGSQAAENTLNEEGKVWSIPVPRDKRSRRHPTPKPPQLMERAMVEYAVEGGLVLDPFMGGAPVGVAAARLGRRYIGAELDPDNFSLAVENVQRELAKLDAIRRIQHRLLPRTRAEAVGYANLPRP